MRQKALLENTQENKNYKILLVVPRYIGAVNTRNYNYMFPLGLGYISAILKREGYSVDCVNLNHYNGTIRKNLLKFLDRKNYDFVCTGNNALGYTPTKAIIDTSREHKSKPRFILGGPIITSEPELIFNNLKPDFAVIGEGDEAVIELLKYLQKNKDLNEVKGLMFWDKSGKPIRTQTRPPPKNVDSLPFPDVESLGFEEYLNHMYPNQYYFNTVFDNPRAYSLLGSRSCPFQCTFCYHDNNLYRPRSVQNIMEELNSRVKKYKINRIYVFDECFAIDKERLKEFCKEIKKLRKELPWELRWMSSLRVDLVNKEILEIMADAGCDVIGYGFESYSSTVLKSMRKNIVPEQIDKAFRATLNAGIGIQANFIFGDIAETKETANETLEYWKKKCYGQVHLDFISPYPNSAIYQHCLKKGIIKNKLKFIEGLSLEGGKFYNMTENMNNKEFSQLNKDVATALSKYRMFIRLKSIKKISRKKYNFEVKCPYCKKIIKYNNFYIKNRFSYSFNVLCKECSMRFYIGSRLREFAYKHYQQANKLRNFKDNILKYIEKINQ